MNPWTIDQLIPEVERLQALGKRVVFTNGVFDLIHTGHLRYMLAARSLGDILIVGLNSDDSVRRLKGEKRPILPQIERVKILGAFDAVDYVIVFEEDTPLNTIMALRPDILVKGADYTLNQIVGKDEVEGWGGQVRTIELVAGVSSSEIIKRIVQSQKQT